MSNKPKKKNKIPLFSNIGIREERYFFIENLAMLLASGMDIVQALAAIKKEVRSRRLKEVINQLKADIDDGFFLWRALQKTGLLSDHIISLVRIGEESGRLPDNLKIIVQDQQKDRVFRSKIYSAMLYPALVLFITFVIGVVIAWFILPRLSSVFDQLRLELPVITRVLIALGNFLGSYGSIVIPVFILVLVLVIYFVFIFSKSRYIGHALLFGVPGVKRLIQEVELARSGFILGTLLEAGLPILDALDSLIDATIFIAYKKLYIHLRDSVEEGNSFQRSFASYQKVDKLIPASIQQMFISGEQSGHLSEILLKVSEIYEDKTEATTKNLAVILEPVLLVVVWFGVVFVALAVILPIYSLIGGLSQGANTSNSLPPIISEKAIEEDVGLLSNESDKEVKISEELAVEDVESEINELVSQPIVSVGLEVKEKVLEEDVDLFSNESYKEVGVLEGMLVEEFESELEEMQKQSVQKLEIIPTGIGYLNVRSKPSLGGKIINRVIPGEVYEYINKENGWFEIVLLDEEVGWVFGRYIKILDL